MLTSTKRCHPLTDYSAVSGWLRDASDWTEVETLAREIDGARPVLPGAADLEAVAHHVSTLLERPYSAPMWSPKASLWDDSEPAYELEISFGTLRARRRHQWVLPDVADDWHMVEGDEITLFELVDELADDSSQGTRGQITGWSKRSRARMAEACAQLDLGEWLDEPGALAMLTLTMPGNWKSLAGSGAEFKKIMKRFRDRWAYKLGELKCVWKLEFQERGAPHLHLLVRVPDEIDGRKPELWIADQWIAACGTVGADARKQRAAHYPSANRPRGCLDIVDQWSDHRRIASYFNKHAAKTGDGKEYQHDVPELWQRPGKGPGRFWGYWGLERAREVVPVTRNAWMKIRRELRKLAEARNAAVQLRRLEHAGIPVARARLSRINAGRMSSIERRELRRLRYRGDRLEAQGLELAPDQAARLDYLERLRAQPASNVGGMWVLVNDGLDLAVRLASLYTGVR
ncbi:hypothetical protein [Demequina sp. NBRC 110055]|uniref:rolling circle replication-associated protein n=1 Tax=Demequina sp. NBRC 110055 TaxID=1570344 RepID=UPI0011852AA6|nr:hypothetical protein [Demequina sp. NBRC 110055]